MQDWNVIATVHEHHYKTIKSFLGNYGQVGSSDFFNVITLKVDDIGEYLERLREAIQKDFTITSKLSHVMPVTQKFNFQNVEEFEERAKQAVEGWVAELVGKSFHVRIHRRGFKGRLSSPEEERFLDGFLIEKSTALGTPAKIDFNDPDLIIAVETLGQQAGLSLWTREQLERYPFLKLD